jgi:hypothetical protein
MFIQYDGFILGFLSLVLGNLDFVKNNETVILAIIGLCTQMLIEIIRINIKKLLAQYETTKQNTDWRFKIILV